MTAESGELQQHEEAFYRLIRSLLTDVATAKMGVISNRANDLLHKLKYVRELRGVAQAVREPLVRSLTDMVEAIEKQAIRIDSPNIGGGDPEIGYEPHYWHEEWLHYAKSALHAQAAKPSKPAVSTYCAHCDHEHQLHEDARGFHHVIKGERVPCCSASSGPASPTTQTLTRLPDGVVCKCPKMQTGPDGSHWCCMPSPISSADRVPE